MPNNTADNETIASMLEADLEAGLELELGLDDFEELEALLTESKKLAEDAAAGKAYRERLRRGGLRREEVQQIEAKLREWEARREWQNIANCSLFTHYTCNNCGSESHIFGGMYYHQKHRHMNHTHRYVAATQSIEGQTFSNMAAANLPNRVILSEQTTPMCQHCAQSLNWDISKGTKGWGGQ